MTLRPRQRGTLPSPSGRPCTYCPNPGAACCVRVQKDGRHIYAHRICAALGGALPMYVFVDDMPRIGPGQ
ncbi:hypothetical protein [Streptomyces sp. NPDC058579]|uniref:hypothetical protein n=1 Tax=Streptomyces sp. NPDC058579 TaxID=3346548 RepID=UPI00364F2B75